MDVNLGDRTNTLELKLAKHIIRLSTQQILNVYIVTLLDGMMFLTLW